MGCVWLWRIPPVDSTDVPSQCGLSRVVLVLSGSVFKRWCDETACQQSLARGPPAKVDFIPSGKMLSGNLKLELPE